MNDRDLFKAFELGPVSCLVHVLLWFMGRGVASCLLLLMHLSGMLKAFELGLASCWLCVCCNCFWWHVQGV